VAQLARRARGALGTSPGRFSICSANSPFGELDYWYERTRPVPLAIITKPIAIAEIEAKIAAPLRSAIKAAQLLGVEVPEKYQTARLGGVPNGKRSQGKFSVFAYLHDMVPS
jgi:hypothetical protein